MQRRAPGWRPISGFEAQYLNGLAPNLNLPGALRVELTRDAGPAEFVQDNTDIIRAALGAVTTVIRTIPPDQATRLRLHRRQAARADQRRDALRAVHRRLGVRALRRRRRA